MWRTRSWESESSGETVIERTSSEERARSY